MADRYCDPSLGGTTTAAGTAPTGGYADDGDGNATSRATAGTVVITVTDYTQWVAGSDSLSVIGATAITIAAPSSNNDMASKLATAINASTATNGNSTVNPRTAQLRNLVNAVASGADVTIYTRTGGTAWNSLTVTTTKAAAFSTSFPVTFSGATAGAWAYLGNVSTLWPASYASATYGLWCSTLPFTGALAAGDIVHVRSNDTVITYTATAAHNFAAQGSAAAPITYLIDNNNKWADGANKTLTLRMNSPNSIGLTFGATSGTSAFLHIKGQLLSTGARNLAFAFEGTPNSSNLVVYFGAPMTFECVDIRTTSNAGTSSVLIRDGGTAAQTTFINCRMQTGQATAVFQTSFGGARLLWVGGVIRGKTSADTQAGTASTGLFSCGTAFYSMVFIGTKFLDWVVGSVLAASGNMAGKLVMNNCDFGNVTVRSPILYTSALNVDPSSRVIAISSQYGQRDWSFESGHGIAEWNSSRSFPTRNALQFDGVTKWVMRFCASTSSGTSLSNPLGLPRIGKINSLANGTRTVTAHFVLEKGLTWTAKAIFIQVQYTNTSGDLVTVSSQDVLGGALTADENGEWSVYGSGADAANVVWNNAGDIFHKQYKIAVSCPDMATNTDVGVFMFLASSVSTTAQGGFLDPDFDIA